MGWRPPADENWTGRSITRTIPRVPIYPIGRLEARGRPQNAISLGFIFSSAGLLYPTTDSGVTNFGPRGSWGSLRQGGKEKQKQTPFLILT